MPGPLVISQLRSSPAISPLRPAYRLKLASLSWLLSGMDTLTCLLLLVSSVRFSDMELSHCKH